MSKNVYQMISEVTAALARRGVSKDQVNQFDKYRFRGIDDLYNAMAPHLAQAGLLIMPNIETVETNDRATAKGGSMSHVTLTVQYTFISSEDGSTHQTTMIGEAMDRGDKAVSKALSAAYKNLCFQAFSIPVEGQDDPERDSHETTSVGLTELQWSTLSEAMAAAKATEEQICKAYALNSIAEFPAAKFDEIIARLNKKAEGDNASA